MSDHNNDAYWERRYVLLMLDTLVCSDQRVETMLPRKSEKFAVSSSRPAHLRDCLDFKFVGKVIHESAGCRFVKQQLHRRS